MRLQLAQPYSLRERLASAVRNSMPVRYPDLGLICLGLFVMLLGVGAIAPIRAIYARDHGATMAELGMMASAFLLGQFVFQLPGGWASDRWGRKPLLVLGVAVAGVVTFMFLLSDNPWYFIVLRFIEGAAAGAINPSANAYVIDAVPAKERGVAFGWLGSAFSAGFMLGPAIGGLMADILGTTSPFIFGGIAPLLVAVFLIRKMASPKRAPYRKPGEMQAAGVVDAIPAGESPARRQIPRHLFVPALIGALVVTVGSGFGDGLFISLWTLWMADLHASTTLIGVTFVTFSLPLMLLMPLSGKLADKYRLAPLVALPGILISFVYLTYGFSSNLLLITSIGLLEGALVAVMVPATSSFVANLSPDNARGRLQGIISTSRTTAGFISSMLVAILYQWGALYPFLMLAGVQLLVSIVGGTIIWRVEKRADKGKPESKGPGEPPAPQASPVLENAAK
jgi:MFS family permease